MVMPPASLAETRAMGNPVALDASADDREVLGLISITTTRPVFGSWANWMLVRTAWGSPSLIVNSAGAGIWRFLEETTTREIDSMIGAPYLAAAHTTRAFIGDMIAAGHGLLIHIASPASIIPWPGATAYTATRWALRGLHEALHQDLRGTGVSTSLAYFGEVSSDYFKANPDSHEHIPSLGSWIPVSTPESCAEVILGIVRRPRPVVYHPFALRLMAWTAALAPAPTRWLIARTGRKH